MAVVLNLHVVRGQLPVARTIFLDNVISHIVRQWHNFQWWSAIDRQIS